MRRHVAGVMAWMWAALVCAGALGQVKGEVESIGFSSLYRPDCWTPMVVRLRPETGATGTYQIQVVQEDLDKDRVVYARTITLTGNAEGQAAREQRFWTYFIPQATGETIRGLPDSSEGLARLQEKLKVFVATSKGAQIEQLPLTSTINKIDGYHSPWAETRGTKMILVVSDPDSGSQAMSRDYAIPQQVLGVLEDVAMVPVGPAELPDNVIGYDAVDAVVLLHVDPQNLKLPTDERWRALKQYVQGGGRLVVCQLPEWQKMEGYGDLLPVTFPAYGSGEGAPQGNIEVARAEPLRRIAKAEEDPAWDRAKGPLKLGLAEAKGGAVVDEWVEWKKDPGVGVPAGVPEKTPYLARQVYGTGSVTWVGQDLGDTGLARARTNWSNVWDRVFDWKHETIIANNLTSKADKDAYAMGQGIELGQGLLLGMEHGRKGATMVFVAVVFFIAYWVLAGPVAYFVLLKQEKAALSWFVFGASAVAATLVTVLVVKVALSGPAEIRHTTVMRTGVAVPATADARVGLYIPRDGDLPVTLKDTAPDTVSYLVPFPIHPQFIKGNEYPAYKQYTVPVRDATAEESPTVYFPFRRTLKKIEAHWVGLSSKGIEGSVQLLAADQGYLSGTVTNGTGHDLKNVYMAFKFPVTQETTQDWVLYVPRLSKGGTIDLGQEWKASVFLPPDVRSVEGSKSVRGIIGQAGRELQWDGYWLNMVRGAASIGSDNNFTDLGRSFVMLSLFERMPPMKINVEHKNRFELLRRGARRVDLSGAMAAGAMVVVAEAEETPLPFEMDVEGAAVEGGGNTYYQAVIPIDRTQANAATTQP